MKNSILKKYKHKLSEQTQYLIYKEIISYYKYTVPRKQIRNSLFIFKSLFLNINVLKINFFKKTSFLLKLCASFLSYLMFSKGEKFLKFKI